MFVKDGGNWMKGSNIEFYESGYIKTTIKYSQIVNNEYITRKTYYRDSMANSAYFELRYKQNDEGVHYLSSKYYNDDTSRFKGFKNYNIYGSLSIIICKKDLEYIKRINIFGMSEWFDINTFEQCDPPENEDNNLWVLPDHDLYDFENDQEIIMPEA
jgi:hypothetical protein